MSRGARFPPVNLVVGPPDHSRCPKCGGYTCDVWARNDGYHGSINGYIDPSDQKPAGNRNQSVKRK